MTAKKTPTRSKTAKKSAKAPSRKGKAAVKGRGTRAPARKAAAAPPKKKGARLAAAAKKRPAGAKPAAKPASRAAARPAVSFNNRPKKPGRGAPPPKIGRGTRRGAPAPQPRAAAKAGRSGGSARKPSRQRVRVCKQENCMEAQTTQGYCRLHYLQNWRALREEKAKRAQKNLDRYVERMAGAKKPATEDEDGAETKSEEAVFEEDFGEFVDVLSREENLDKILNGIKVEDY